MGLTNQSVGKAAVDCGIDINKKDPQDVVVALAGNPNVGKSTVFNALTGMRQHTGNWPGKTVTSAVGYAHAENQGYIIVDLPGSYSLSAHSAEEEVTRGFILEGEADVTVVVCDGTCLERNLILALQILATTSSVVVCVNLLDEAKKKHIEIDLPALSEKLGVPVVGTSARKRTGLSGLLDAVKQVAETPPKGFSFGEENPDITEIVRLAEEVSREVLRTPHEGIVERDRKIDKWLTGKTFGFPLMFLLLMGIFWITLEGANYPSAWLSKLLFGLEAPLYELLCFLPLWLRDMLVFGAYRVTAWVVSVMLPPMAIFFPLFTLLEDFGYLPRVAFNLDKCFQKCRACGKQALTM